MTDNILNKIEDSFKRSLKGEESVDKLIYWWGVPAYLAAFIINKILRSLHIYFINVPVSVVLICYFAWHFYALKKCAPKKPKLTKEEKQKLSEERRKELPKKLMRKFLLQESFTKWDPVFVSFVVDAFCIAQFMGYII